ncbi:hypothetical protein DESA109040_08370 [Deinococcus saxicola]
MQVAPAPAAAYRATTAQHLITIALAWWLLAGLFLDGWDSFDCLVHPSKRSMSNTDSD